MNDDNNRNDGDSIDSAELLALLGRAKALPREIAPSEESWDRIRTRIDATRVRELPLRATQESDVTAAQTVDPAIATTTRDSWWRGSRTTFAAAAVLLVSVTTFVVVRESRDEAQTLEAAVAQAASPIAAKSDANDVAASTASGTAALQTPSATVAGAALSRVFAQYDEATSDLTRGFEERRARLQPEAVAVLDSCLVTIDKAIRESRNALAAEPENTTIAELLQLTYQQKMDLLRRASDLPTVSLED